MDAILSAAVLIFAFVLFFGFIWGTIRYIKACSYYYYTPVKIMDCMESVISVFCPILGIVLAGTLRTHIEGIAGGIMSVVVLVSSIFAGIAIVLYLIRKIESQTGSRKFAVASFVVQMFFGYLGLASMGLFLLAGMYLVNRLGEGD